MIDQKFTKTTYLLSFLNGEQPRTKGKKCVLEHPGAKVSKKPTSTSDREHFSEADYLGFIEILNLVVSMKCCTRNILVQNIIHPM